MTTQPREILFDESARAKLRDGIEKLANVVVVTLGPTGCNVCYQSWQPTITKDGSSIVKEVELKDQFENMGVSIAKEVANRVREQAGDGTTTSILLLSQLVNQGVKLIASGASPILLKRGMDKAIEKVIHNLEAMAIPVKDPQDILDIATVSASGDREIGSMIAEAFEKVGHSGVITIEEAKSTDSSIELVEGMQFDRGYLSPYFCTNVESMQCELPNPAFLLVDGKISSIQEMLPLLQTVAAQGIELLIIADDLEADVLSTLVVNRLRGALRVTAVKAPGFGDRKKALLGDLAVLTGATLISEDTGTSLRHASLEMLGSADRVVITKDKTTIVGGSGSPEAIKARIAQIEAEEKTVTNNYDREKLQERKAKLSEGVAIIRVGAMTEPVLKHRKQLFQDSLNSTRSALKSGIVVGGGTALLRASRDLDQLKLEGDESLGVKLVAAACEAPVKQIARNSACDPSIILQEVLASSSALFGFNAKTGQVENLRKAGVVDAVAGIVTYLNCSSSAAGIALLSEALVGDAEVAEPTCSH